ncbi:MAG: hypothetical protein B6I38_05845, partial [Anaerolineaceae bacterium 4572_5.1]
TPVWPGSRKFSLKRAKNLEAGDDANVSILECDVHTGTHIDAPGHFIRGAETVEQISLNKLIGPAYVVYIPDVNTINAGDLDKLKLPAEVKRLLLRTRNSELWNRGAIEFNKKFVALTSGAAQWIVDRGIDLIGIDYLSIQRFTDPPITHRILLEAKVVIVEGLNQIRMCIMDIPDNFIGCGFAHLTSFGGVGPTMYVQRSSPFRIHFIFSAGIASICEIRV